MTIVDARAINYEQMKSFVDTKRLVVNGTDIQPHTKIYTISITDPSVSPIFDNESENIIMFSYKDVETNYRKRLIDFCPEERTVHHMSELDAKRIVQFIQLAEADKEDAMVLVNCMFGQCRSGAIVDFISTIFGFGCYNTKNRNPQIIPNQWNQFLLYKEYFNSLT